MTNVVLPALQIDGGGHVSGFSLAEYNGTISCNDSYPHPHLHAFSNSCTSWMPKLRASLVNQH